MCSICYEEFSGTSTHVTTICGHQYHRECIRKWLDNNTSCPLCRTDIAVQRPRDTHRSNFLIENNLFTVYDYDDEVRVYAVIEIDEEGSDFEYEESEPEDVETEANEDDEGDPDYILSEDDDVLYVG